MGIPLRDGDQQDAGEAPAECWRSALLSVEMLFFCTLLRVSVLTSDL